MNDETPSQYPKQVPMAVPIRVPSRCGVKALLRAPLVWPHPGLSAGAAPVSLHLHILRQFAAHQPRPLPKACVLLTIMVSDVFIPWRRMATSVKTSMRGP